MGSPKGLLRTPDGQTLLELQLDRLSRACKKVLLVLGAQGAQLRAYLKEFPWLTPGGWAPWPRDTERPLELLTLINPQPELGPFSSLQLALKWEFPYYFCLPVDVPAPPGPLFELLERTLLETTAWAVVPTYQGKGGHPILLTQNFAKVLLQVPIQTPEARLDFQLRKLGPDHCYRLPVALPEILCNLNTPSDWQAFVKSIH